MKFNLYWINEGKDYSCKEWIGGYKSLTELNLVIMQILNERPSIYWTLYFEEVV